MADKTIGGFFHLSGIEVYVLLDGHLHMGTTEGNDIAYQSVSVQTVTNGAVTVPEAFYGSVRVGLEYTATLKTMPVSFEAAAAARGMVKNVSRVFSRMNGAGNAQVGPSGNLVSMLVSETAVDDMPPMVEIPILGAWDEDACVVIQHSDPEPFTLQAIALEVATGG